MTFEQILLGVSIGLPWILGAILALLDGRRRWVGHLAVWGLAVGFLVLLALGVQVLSGGPVIMTGGGWRQGLGITFRADALGVVFALVSIGVVLASLLHEVATGVYWRTFPAVVVLGAAGMTGLFLTGDVFNFYVFFEIAMTSAFVLAGYREADHQVRGAFLFAIVNLVGSTIFLIAIAALYTVTGTLDMALMAERTNVVEIGSLIAVATLVFAAFGLKLGLFPFHFWLPNVYVGTHPSVAAILAGALANIGAYGLLRFGGGIFARELEFAAPVVMTLGVVSLVYGALQAVSRRDATEVLAYSAIGQAGYIILALGVGGPGGFAAAIVYAVVNSLNKGVLFLTTGLVGSLAGVTFALGAFSVAGIPPFGGYLGKLSVFRALADLPPAQSALLIGLVVLGSAMSVLYMFQTYQRRYLAKQPSAEDSPPKAGPLAYLPVLVLALLMILVGLLPEPLLAAAVNAASAGLGVQR